MPICSSEGHKKLVEFVQKFYGNDCGIVVCNYISSFAWQLHLAEFDGIMMRELRFAMQVRRYILKLSPTKVKQQLINAVKLGYQGIILFEDQRLQFISIDSINRIIIPACKQFANFPVQLQFTVHYCDVRVTPNKLPTVYIRRGQNLPQVCDAYKRLREKR